MRLLIIILLFSLNAQGQIINASAPYRPFASVSLLLDTYTGATAAYSLRKLRTVYTGSAIRVRRTSDNAEQDIGFTASGDLDTTSLKTFVGANSGFVTTWYDQSGNGRNATQSTQSEQPRIVLNGVIYRYLGKPNIQFLGNSFLSASYGSATSFSSFLVWSYSSLSLSYTRIISLRTGNFDTDAPVYIPVLRNQSVSEFGTYLSGANTVSNISTSINTNYLWSNIHTGSSFTNYANGSASSSTNHTLNHNFIVLSIGGVYNGAAGLTGSIPEIVLYNSNQSANRTGIESNINSYYSIY